MITRRVLLKSALLLPTLQPLSLLAAHAQEGGPVRDDGHAQGVKAGGEPALPNAPWLEAIARQLQAELNLPAVWLAANIEDKVEAAVVGVRKYGDPTPATLNDDLTVASISKPMAGLWIATLVEQGKLSYETKVLDVLPELATACLPEHRDINLGQLVTHTAGVVRDANAFPDNLLLEQYPAERLRQAKYILSTPGPPDSKGKELYSNNGLTLAATMAERVVGEPYEVAAGRFYREKLGLKSWGVWPMNRPDDLTVPWPHAMNGPTPVPLPPHSVAFHFVRPSGSAHCTIRELVRFGLLGTNATALSRSVLTPDDWEVMMLEVPNTSAVLTSFHTSGERAAFNHTGSLTTTSSNLLVIPDWKVCFAFHTNAQLKDDDFTYAIDLVQDAFRKQRAELSPPTPCNLAITGVDTMDEQWQKVIVPRATDAQIRIRVNLKIEAPWRTGDLKTSVKLGDVERRDNRYRGLVPGNHNLRFVFETPKATTLPVEVALDALDTAGNRTPDLAHYKSMLTIV